MRLLFLLACFCYVHTSFGQQDAEVSISSEDSPKSGRSQFIKGYPDDFFIWPVLKQRKLDFDMRMLSGNKPELAFRSNKPYSLGVGMYLFEMAAEIAFAIPLDEQNKHIFGESRARDLYLNVLGKRWGVDAFHQRYKGFYLLDSRNKVPANTPYPQRPDVGTRNVGVTLNYTFNHQRFSFRSPYNFNERQLRSAGSPVLFGSLRNFNVAGDSALAGDGYVESFGDVSAIKKINVTVLGFAPGYTYSLIYKGFFLNGTFAIGPGYNWIGYEYENGTSADRKKFNTMVAARLALGFNGDKVFGGFAFMNQGGNAKFSNMDLNISNSSFKILVGYRFKETGILKKRVWDIIPAALR